MKNFTFFKLNATRILLFGALSFVLMPFSSCSNDDVDPEDYFLNIEGDPTSLSVGVEGTEQKYIVRSNTSWEVVAQSEEDWVEVSPQKRDGNGVFRFIVDENTGFEDRSMNFKFLMNGVEKDLLFRIDQKASAPYLELKGVGDEINVPSVEKPLIISVNSNVDWSYSFGDVDWLEKEEDAEGNIKLLVHKNEDAKRSATITISSSEHPDLTKEILLVQASENVLINEDFSWLAYGSTVPYEWEDAVRYDSWTADQKGKGWTTTPVAASKNQPLLYAQNGWVKLGKTGYGGDIISPKLDGIKGTKTVKVTFRAATYISAGGNKDDNILKVSAIGPGDTDASMFEIDNYPNSKDEDEAGVENNIWDPSRSYSFEVTGATADTQIKFLGNDYELKGVGQGKNRIILENIRVEIVKPE